MESELAKTLRSMSDDHRMVPDFSEKLLDIADAIERQAKELNRSQQALHKAESDRESLLAEVERLNGALEARTDDLRALQHAVVLASSR